MSRSVLYMSMAVDGYIDGPNDEPGNPGGDDFMRLHEWFGFASDTGRRVASIDPSGVRGQFLDEIKATGAVLVGRNTAEQADHWGGDHHNGVPIFVLSHRPPGPAAGQHPLGADVAEGIVRPQAQADG